jgi:hypothetical protein
MTDRSAIEWTQATWNPVTGCDRISPGCQHCYALTLATRLKAMGQAKYQTDGDRRTSGSGFGVAVHPHALLEPLGWRRPRRIFVCSMADLFHARVPEAFIAQLFAVMATAGHHTYQVLTKRLRRMEHLLGSDAFAEQVFQHATGYGVGSLTWEHGPILRSEGCGSLTGSRPGGRQRRTCGRPRELATRRCCACTPFRDLATCRWRPSASSRSAPGWPSCPPAALPPPP